MEPAAINPYAAPLHGADAPAIGDGPVVYVGFWRRVLASIVDNILTTVVVLPLFWLLYGTWTAQGMFESRALLQNLLVAVVIITLWHRYGATPGKMMWNARILDERTLRPPTLGKLILRYLGYIPSALVLGLGFLWVAFDRKKRGWHDLMAGTVVVVQPRVALPPSDGGAVG